MKNIGQAVFSLLVVAALTGCILYLLELPSPEEGRKEGSRNQAEDLQESRTDVEVFSEDSRKETDGSKEKTGSASSVESKETKDADSKKEGQAPKMGTVGRDYFSDALFIGDSRTVGMEQSQLLPEATYYAKVGIGIGQILEEAIVYEGGAMMTVPQALQYHTFGKVYIMIGINDMSEGDVTWFLGKYKEIIETVQKTQPDALIYIQGNIPMSYYKQEANGALTNENLNERNWASRGLTDNKKIFYLETQSIYADSYGNLNSSYTNDGLHVKLQYYNYWVDYLKNHAVLLEDE